MKVAPESKISTLSRPDSPSRFKIEKIDELGHHGISIGGFYISSSCNTFLLVMAIIFIVGGIIFTAISYRPRDRNEDMERYKERQASDETSQVKIVGPIFVILGLIMLFGVSIFTVTLYFLQKQESSRYQMSRNRELHRIVSVVSCNVLLKMAKIRLKN